MRPREVIGWASSLVLLLTLVAQTRKQWRSASTRGVSQWLYVGEAVAAAEHLVRERATNYGLRLSAEL